MGPEPGVGGQNPVVAVPVDAGRWNQSGERFEEFEGREGEEGAAVGRGTGRPVDHPTDAGVIGPGSRIPLDAQAVEGEGGPGAVAQEPLPPGAVGAMDVDGGIETEPTGALRRGGDEGG